MKDLMAYNMKSLENLMVKKRGSVNPKKFIEEEFELYSIPAYDDGSPKLLKGGNIGSSKKKVETGDVLLSRIVPHIRRAWIVSSDSDIRKIGSGEWIIFNSEEVDNSYLKYFFHSKLFDVQFLKDLRGVGGSLLRANPKIVGKIQIPLPPLPIQRRIAAILDQVDALRRKDAALLARYDALAQSVFLELFGDPVRNEKGWEKVKLGELCEKITDGTHHSPPAQEEGVPYITAKHLKKRGLDFYSNPTYVLQEDHEKIYSRCSPEKGDVLYIKDGATTGLAAINNYDFEFSMLSSLALIKPRKERLNNLYLMYWLNAPIVKKYLTRTMAGAAIKRFTLKKIKSFEIPLPPLDLQVKFQERIKNIEQQKQIVLEQQKKSEALFQSLLQKAFKGELVSAETLDEIS